MVRFPIAQPRNREVIPIAVIVENGVKLRLNIVDTPGYGDQVNNENWYVITAPPPRFFIEVSQLGPHCQVHQGPAQRVSPQGADRHA